MKNSTPKSSFSLLGLVCNTFGHDYIITRKVTNHINEYKCSHCGREVTDSPAGNLEVLTNKIKQVNTCVASFFQKRTQRLSA